MYNSKFPCKFHISLHWALVHCATFTNATYHRFTNMFCVSVRLGDAQLECALCPASARRRQSSLLHRAQEVPRLPARRSARPGRGWGRFPWGWSSDFLPLLFYLSFLCLSPLSPTLWVCLSQQKKWMKEGKKEWKKEKKMKKERKGKKKETDREDRRKDNEK